jgi:hypothetical protein
MEPLPSSVARKPKLLSARSLVKAAGASGLRVAERGSRRLQDVIEPVPASRYF